MQQRISGSLPSSLSPGNSGEAAVVCIPQDKFQFVLRADGSRMELGSGSFGTVRWEAVEPVELGSSKCFSLLLVAAYSLLQTGAFVSYAFEQAFAEAVTGLWHAVLRALCCRCTRRC